MQRRADWPGTAIGVVAGVVLVCALVGLVAHPGGPAALRTSVAATLAVLALMVSGRRRGGRGPALPAEAESPVVAGR